MIDSIKNGFSIIKGNIKGLLELKNRGPIFDSCRRMSKMYIIFDGEIKGEVAFFLKERCVYNNPKSEGKLKIYSGLKDLLFDNGFVGARLIDTNSKCLRQGWTDFGDDWSYGKPFDSVGGPDSRYEMKVSKKVNDFEAYLAGYQYHALLIYGEHWKDVFIG